MPVGPHSTSGALRRLIVAKVSHACTLLGYKVRMTTPPGDSTGSDNRDEHDEHDPAEVADIDDSKLPEDLQPSEDNPLAAGPDEEASAADAGGEPPD